MLSIKQLSVQRGQGEQAHRVHLEQLHVKPGQITAITGPSGCGKSTLLESIGLLLKPTHLAQYDLGDPPVHLQHWATQSADHIAAIRSKKMGFMLQQGGLIPYLTVSQNISLPRRLLGLSPTSDDMHYALEQLGLMHLLHQPPSALSIGERQRVAFVRALAHEPQLLLADEPTAALDPIHAQQLFELFVHIVKKLNVAALVISHDWDLIRAFGFTELQAQVSPGVCHFV